MTRNSGWPSHYKNVGCLARLKTSFKLNPVTEGKKRSFSLSQQSPNKYHVDQWTGTGPHSIDVAHSCYQRADMSLQFSVYLKPTHINQYIQIHYHQPMEQMMGVIRMLAHRSNTNYHKRIWHRGKVQTYQEGAEYGRLRQMGMTGPLVEIVDQPPRHSDYTWRKGHTTLPCVSGVTE